MLKALASGQVLIRHMVDENQNLSTRQVLICHTVGENQNLPTYSWRGPCFVAAK